MWRAEWKRLKRFACIAISVKQRLARKLDPQRRSALPETGLEQDVHSRSPPSVNKQNAVQEGMSRVGSGAFTDIRTSGLPGCFFKHFPGHV